MEPNEHEAIVLMAEECAEVVQAITKTLRHGFSSWNPFDPDRVPNRCLIAKEIGDVLAALDILVQEGVVAREEVELSRKDKLAKVGKYLHHIDVKP